jgi:hypothetical protein
MAVRWPQYESSVPLTLQISCTAYRKWSLELGEDYGRLVWYGYYSGTTDDALSILYYQGPETQQTSVRWSRPAPPPLNPAHHVLMFQQLDIDHYTGTVYTSLHIELVHSWCRVLDFSLFYSKHVFCSVFLKLQTLILQSVQSILNCVVSFKFKMAWCVLCVLCHYNELHLTLGLWG